MKCEWLGSGALDSMLFCCIAIMVYVCFLDYLVMVTIRVATETRVVMIESV